MHFCMVEVTVLFQPLDYGVLQRLVIGVFQWARQSKIWYRRHQTILL